MVAYGAWSFPMWWFAQRPGLAIGGMLGLMVVACLLTLVDPIIRARQVPPLLALGGWGSMAALPLLLLLFGEDGLAFVMV